MRKHETIADYAGIKAEVMAHQIAEDSAKLRQLVEAGETDRMSRATLKRVAAMLNNIMIEIE